MEHGSWGCSQQFELVLVVPADALCSNYCKSKTHQTLQMILWLLQVQVYVEEGFHVLQTCHCMMIGLRRGPVAWILVHSILASGLIAGGSSGV